MYSRKESACSTVSQGELIMETKPSCLQLIHWRMLALLVHYFAGYLYVYRIVTTKNYACL